MSIIKSRLQNSFSRENLAMFLQFINFYVSDTERFLFSDNYLCRGIDLFCAKYEKARKRIVLKSILEACGVNTSSSFEFSTYLEKYQPTLVQYNIAFVRNLRRLVFLFCVRKLILEILDENSID